MREKPKIRPYRDSDYEEILNVLDRNFKRQDDFFAEVWTWQIEENPHRFDDDEPTRYVLAKPSDDKPVGFVANLPMRFLIEGELVRAVNPMHYSVDEEYRFHGVPFLYNILNRSDVFLTASAGAVSKLILQKYGCCSIDMTTLVYKVGKWLKWPSLQVIGKDGKTEIWKSGNGITHKLPNYLISKLPNYQIFLNKVFRRLMRTLFRRLVSLMLLLLYRVKMRFRHRTDRQSVHVWKVDRFDEIEQNRASPDSRDPATREGQVPILGIPLRGKGRGAKGQEDTEKSSVFSVIKDVEYLNWRYIAFPMQPTKDEFHIWAGRLGDKTGYIVLNLRPDGRAMIYDLSYGSEMRLATTLIQTAVKWSIRHCRLEVLAPCLPEADRTVFENVGFEVAKDGMTNIIFYHRNKDIMSKMGDKSYWNVYFGDLEISHCM